jgi:hypothetical protein
MRDNELIQQIAVRAEMMYAKKGIDIDAAFIKSELWTVHYEICTLRLQALLETDEGNFAHDIAGIHQHLNILDASFRNGFSPRFAK